MHLGCLFDGLWVILRDFVIGSGDQTAADGTITSQKDQKSIYSSMIEMVER